MAAAENRSYFNQLTLSGFNCCCLTVDEQEYDLFGVVCSDSENDDEWELLESYLTQVKTINSSSQSMARTKQTARKVTGRPPGRSTGGQPLARFSSPNTRSQGNLLDGDSELEEAANLFAVDMNLPRLRSGSSPGRSSNPSGTPPGRGRAGRGRGRSPRSSTPGRGTIPIRGAGRSIPPGLPVSDPPRPSRLQGFLSGRGGFAVRGRNAQPKPTLDNVVASTSSGGNSGLKRLLPSFSSDDDDDYNTARDDGDDNEVSFKPARKRLKTVPAAKKNLNLIRGNRPKGPSGFQKVAAANRSARTGAINETKRGWYLKPDKRPGSRRNKPGVVALREIRFYQKSRVMLIPMRPFIRLVREIALDHTPSWGGQWRWQANALFALQQAAESYLVGLFGDCVLLAIYCKRVTVMRDDIPFVLRLRCKQPLGEPHADT